MARLNVSNNFLRAQQILKNNGKNRGYVTSKEIRQTFLDYFTKDNNHAFVRSSPVVPFCDPTVAFVNAGMNQFKGIFLGNQTPAFPRVANVQKCVRVGGKHNDLSIVGTDGYHHTFFEMMGNWSFGDYFKREACSLAWNLLTKSYRINPSSLYVTYFAGDPALNLEPDFECKDIWRSIGVPESHILPFGPKENFWEMGATGPCGPCTEIHVDHTNGANRGHDVNKDLPNLTELWNLVFIQYDRNSDGTITSLPQRHIDTGMGFERLTALLQGKDSNYDTDIFTGTFKTIQKVCRGLPEYGGKFGVDDANGVDTAYRILADHSRMITVCLADGMIPEENQKLRRIIRKIMSLSETMFKDGVLREVVDNVIENLGAFYPEIQTNRNRIQNMLKYEDEVYKSIRTNSVRRWSEIVQSNANLQGLNVVEMPGLIAAYDEMSSTNITSISPQLAFKLYDSHGLDEEVIKMLSDALGIRYVLGDLNKELNIVRQRTKERFLTDQDLSTLTQSLKQTNVTKTDDSYKYGYKTQRDDYIFDDLNVKVLCIIKDNQIVPEVTDDCHLILNKTNLYTEAGGQISDQATIAFGDAKFVVSEALNVNGYILHKGKLQGDHKLQTGAVGTLQIDRTRRSKTMANHTAVHLLNAALKSAVSDVTCQKSSKVTPEYFSFDVGVYSKKLCVDDIEKVEGLIRRLIEKRIEVRTNEIDSQQLLNLENVTLIPGEVYPDTGIRIIEIVDAQSNFVSREPCCGTHVRNTSDIRDMCVVSFRSTGRSTTALTAVTGDKAVQARVNGTNLLNKLQNIEKSIENNQIKNEEVNEIITEYKRKLQYNDEDFLIPVVEKLKCLNLLNNLSKRLRNMEREYLREFVELEMKSIVGMQQKSDQKQFIVHYLDCSCLFDDVPLQKATKVCPDRPVLVISYSNDMVKARCCVPESMVTKSFNAKLWLKSTVADLFKSSASTPRGQNEELVCNMKEKHVNKLDWENLLSKALADANEFAGKNL